MKNTDWEQARAYVLEYYPKAVCFKYRKNAFVVFSDRNLTNAKRLSEKTPNVKSIINKGMTWIAAKEEIEKANLLEVESFLNKNKKTI